MTFEQQEINNFINSLNLNSNVQISKYEYLSNNELKNFLFGLLYYNQNKNNNYEFINIKKKNNTKRVLRKPKLKIKEIQALILQNYLEKIIVSDNATGFVKGRGIIDNAGAHKKSEKILKLDLKNFFDTINEDMILKSLKNRSSNLSYNYNFARMIADITTVDNLLPTGAPSSPYLSNIVCYKLDFRINKFCSKRDITYTRYADDLTFSGKNITNRFYDQIKKIVEDEGFTINNDKTKFLYKGSKKKVTGYIINDGISIGRKEYKNLLFQLLFCKEYGIVQTINKFNMNIEPESLKNHFLGKIKFAKVRLKYYQNLIKKFNEINWDVHFERIKNISINEDHLRKNKKKIEKIISDKKHIQHLKNLGPWLSNFENDQERNIALNLLSQIRYYTLYDFQEMIYNCFNSYLTYRKCQINGIKNNTVITAVGDVDSSSTVMLKIIRNTLGSEKCPPIKHNSNIESKHLENLIIVDDFIGLGDAFLKDYKKNKSKFEKYKNITFIIPLAYDIGIRKLKDEFENVKIITGTILDSSFIYSSHLSQKENEIMTEVLNRNFTSELKQKKYSSKEHILNIAFEHNIPNNSIPIYWSKSNIKNWFPLFPRYWF